MADNPNSTPGGAQVSQVVKGLIGNLTNAVAALEVGFAVVTAALDRVNETLTEFNDVNNRLAVVNSSLGKLVSENSESLKSAEYGFSLATKALTELRVAGFDENNKNIVALISRFKLTGLDTRGLININKQLLGMGNVQESSLDKLNKGLLDNSIKFGISAQTLVDSLGSLEKNLPTLGLTGGAGTAATALQDAVAAAGEENAAIIRTVFEGLTSTTANLNEQALIGAEAFGDLLTFSNQSLSPDQVQQQLLQIGTRAQELLATGLESGSRRALANIQGGTSQFVLAAAKLPNILAKAADGIGDPVDRFKESLNFIVEKAFDPFVQAVQPLFPAFLLFSETIAELAGSTFRLLISVLGPFISLIGGVAVILGKFISFVFNIISNLADSVFGNFFPIAGILSDVKDGLSEQNKLKNKELAQKEKEELAKAQTIASDPVNQIKLDAVDRLLRDTSRNQAQAVMRTDKMTGLMERFVLIGEQIAGGRPFQAQTVTVAGD